MEIIVKVSPNSKKQDIKKDGPTYKIKLKSEAKGNNANKELISFLSKHFEVPSKNIKIKAGLKSSKKIIDFVK